MPRKAKSQEQESENVKTLELVAETPAPKKRGRKPKSAATATATATDEAKPVRTRRKKSVDPEEIIRQIMTQPEPELSQEDLQEEVKEIQQ